MTLTVGSLFTGIGGIDLGLERVGMTIRWQSEVDPFCNRVLATRWPNVPNLGNIKGVDWSTVEEVDVVCGGYPCQPFSQGGPRGDWATDPRHLWPYFRECLCALRPRFALLENVPGHVPRGFAEVLADLAQMRYDAEWATISAADLGAPHLRQRLFVIAIRPDAHRPLAYPRRSTRASPGSTSQTLLGSSSFQRSRRRSGSDGGHWAVEPDVGRVAHGVPDRLDRLRALGNAVVPQVAEFVGRRLLDIDASLA